MTEQAVDKMPARSRAKDSLERAADAVAQLRRMTDALQSEMDVLARELSRYDRIDPDELRAFLREPWCVLPKVLGLKAIGRLVGPKLVVVPTATLVEQWEERLRKYIDLGLRSGEHAVDVVTYSAWHKVAQKQYTLAIFDECHRLPAPTFSRLSTVRTKYRIGMSATPHREDGNERFIVALTGYPVGMDWTEFLRSGLVKPPDVEVRIVRGGWPEKQRVAQAECAKTKGRVLVFCDSLAPGAELASRLKCPHVHGDTSNRLEAINSSRVCVVSRVGDEGLSLPDLKKVIEVDFLGKSRRQEGQRVGRLLHGDGKGEHLVLMTKDEFDRFEGRFLALEEKGFKVNVVQA